MKTRFLAAAALGAALLAPLPALAHTDLSFGVNLGGPAYAPAPPPVVYQPAPSYVVPAPAYYYGYGPTAVYGPGPYWHHHRYWHDRRYWRR